MMSRISLAACSSLPQNCVRWSDALLFCIRFCPLKIALPLPWTAWYPVAMWSQHDAEPSNHHAVSDRPPARRQLRQPGRPPRGTAGWTEARAVTVSSAKLMSFVVRCGANGAHELKKIALGRTDGPQEPAVFCCCCCGCWQWCVMQNQMTTDDTPRERQSED